MKETILWNGRLGGQLKKDQTRDDLPYLEIRRIGDSALNDYCIKFVWLQDGRYYEGAMGNEQFLSWLDYLKEQVSIT